MKFPRITWPFNKTVYVETMVPEVVNAAESKSIDKELLKEPLERIRETLKNWAEAVQSAEQSDPDRTDLFNLYANIEFDEHITALTDSILFDITQTPFHIVDDNNEIDPEVTKLFNGRWFYDFIDYYLQADYWGFSLIQFIPGEEGGFKATENVDRWHISPELEGVKEKPNDESVKFSWMKPPYDKYTMFVTSKKHLGRYNNVAKSFIMKREVTQFWAVFNDLFTTPYFIVKTNFNNKNHRNDLINLMTKRRHSGFGVIGEEDEISQLLTYTGTGWNSYKSFLEYANQQMSKAFLGQTMVFEDGSSRSQAEVHERQKDIFVNSRRVLIEYAINEELIPKMIELGYGLNENHKFRWDFSEELSPKDWSEIIRNIGSMFSLDEAEIGEKLGLTLEPSVSIPTTSDADPKKEEKIQQQIKQLYDGLIHRTRYSGNP